VLTLVIVIALALTATASARSTSVCGAQVIDDWYDDGRVDRKYAPSCYDDAIKALPRDVRDYSSAKEDILQAKNARLRGEEAPPATTDPTPGDPIVNVQDPDDFDGDGLANEDDPTPGTQTTQTVTGPGLEPDPDEEDTETVAAVDTTRADALPLPLLVLAGLALALVAAGTAAYGFRRFQARRLPPPTG
jgi:hypothetical protein